MVASNFSLPVKFGLHVFFETYNIIKLLQNVTEVYYKGRQVLQSVTSCYYKVRQVLQSATVIIN